MTALPPRAETRSVRELDRQAKGAEIFRNLSDAFNTMNDRSLSDGFVLRFLAEHNTLQQKLVALFLRCIYALAEQTEGGRWVDARNEAAVAASRKVRDVLGEDGYRMPLI